MTVDLEKEVLDLRRRADAADARLAQLEGSFAFISGQLREVQIYMHSMDQRLTSRLDTLEAKVDAMPRAILEGVREMLDRRSAGI